MSLMQRQKGFTLVEIAVVLVIIGLLLGGVLKGQELIASARVRNLADQQAGIQAAYFGFIDRYRAVPGDMNSTAAATAIGISTPYVGGDSNGRLTDPSGASPWGELNALWAHLADAGFIKGTYPGNATAPTATNGEAPLNVFSSPVILGRSTLVMNVPAARLILHLGQNVPAEIARELDLKLDDGRPATGSVQNSDDSAATNPYQSGPGCDDGGTPAEWDIQTNAQNCNPAFIF